MEFIANGDDDFNKYTETVVTDDESDIDDWNEEQHDCDDEPETEPDFGFYDFCNMRHRYPVETMQDRAPETILHNCDGEGQAHLCTGSSRNKRALVSVITLKRP